MREGADRMTIRVWTTSKFQDMPTGHKTTNPQGETHADTKPDRPELHKQKDSHTKKIFKNLEDQQNVATNKDLPHNRPWEIRLEGNQALKFDLNKRPKRKQVMCLYARC